ncbi:hypothetical protein B0T09DRAFT_352159 [Sordaria sp. MPI-SDFR-AT-0083]|nr:hypothetical protein B0T09DRAFT_352159 [Sordaria sp. MPI-SDFR-AT-0083]
MIHSPVPLPLLLRLVFTLAMRAIPLPVGEMLPISTAAAALAPGPALGYGFAAFGLVGLSSHFPCAAGAPDDGYIVGAHLFGWLVVRENELVGDCNSVSVFSGV